MVNVVNVNRNKAFQAASSLRYIRFVTIIMEIPIDMGTAVLPAHVLFTANVFFTSKTLVVSYSEIESLCSLPILRHSFALEWFQGLS